MVLACFGIKMIKRIISEQRREKQRKERERLEYVKQHWNSPEGLPRRQDLMAMLLGITEWEEL